MKEISAYKAAIKKIKSRKAKLQGWEGYLKIGEMQDVLDSYGNLELAYKKLLKPLEEKKGKSGEKPKIAYKKIAEQIKVFWKDDLRHKKFIYDKGKKIHDQSNEFVDDFLNLIFDVEKTRGLKEALAEISEQRY